MTRIRITAQQLADRHFQIGFTPRLASIVQLLKRAGKGGRKAKTVALYVGFDTQQQAVGFAHQVRARFPNAMVQVRQSKRLGTPIEVKIRHAAVEMLIAELLTAKQTTGDRIQQHIEQHRQRLENQFDCSTAPTQNRSSGRTLVKCGDRFIGID